MKNQKDNDIKLYAVISRTVKYDIGIDWIYPNIMTNDYAQAKDTFNKEKELLQEKMGDSNAVITQDEDRIFEIIYDNFPMRRYVKIIDLY